MLPRSPNQIGRKFRGNCNAVERNTAGKITRNNAERCGARLRGNLRVIVRVFLYADGFELTTPKRIDATSMAKRNPLR
jgi:hypothetical protein